VQLDFFLGNLNDLGLTIQVYSRGPRVYVTGAIRDITLNALCLRLDAKYYSSVASDAKLAEQKSKPHQWKFLNTAHQTQSLAMTAGNIYPEAYTLPHEGRGQDSYIVCFHEYQEE